MDNINIPEEWSIALYGDIYLSASNGIGGTQNKDGVGIPVSRIETISEQRIDYSRIGYLSSFDEDKIKKHKLQQDDVLFSHINSPIHLGKTALYDGIEKLYHGINLLRIVVDKEVFLPKLFNYHCKYIRALGVFSLNAQHAVNQSSINQKKLSAFKIPLPPLAEQKEIAERLDKLLAQVEATQARLASIPDIIKQFRQSVLAAAVSGKLTEEWQHNSSNKLVNNNEIAHQHRIYFHSQGRKYKEPLSINDFSGLPAIPKNWRWYRAEQLCDLITKGTTPSSEQMSASDEIPYIKVYNLTFNGSLDFSINPTFINRQTHENELKRSKVLPGDVLMNIVGPPLGKVSIVPDTYSEWNINQAICLFRPVCGVSEFYLSLCLRDDNLLSLTKMKAKATAGQFNLTLEICRDYPIPVPSPEEQTEIVRRVEQLFAYADSIEQQAKAAKERVDNLTQAILAKAFRGELTADWRAANPDLISGDNSAEALLTRIQAERAQSAKKSRKRTQPAT